MVLEILGYRFVLVHLACELFHVVLTILELFAQLLYLVVVLVPRELLLGSGKLSLHLLDPILRTHLFLLQCESKLLYLVIELAQLVILVVEHVFQFLILTHLFPQLVDFVLVN